MGPQFNVVRTVSVLAWIFRLSVIRRHFIAHEHVIVIIPHSRQHSYLPCILADKARLLRACTIWANPSRTIKRPQRLNLRRVELNTMFLMAMITTKLMGHRRQRRGRLMAAQLPSMTVQRKIHPNLSAGCAT